MRSTRWFAQMLRVERVRHVGPLYALMGLLVALLAAPLDFVHASEPFATLELREALATFSDGASQIVQLPHQAKGQNDKPIKVEYRFDVDLGTDPRGLSLYLPLLAAHSQVRINGHLLVDDLAAQDMRPPRRLFAVRLLHIPDGFLVAGRNQIDIVAAASGALYISRLWIGNDAELAAMRDQRIAGAFVGPALVATAIGCLALCVLLLWVRRRNEVLYFYFGVGALCWALHTAWYVLPYRLMSPMHHLIWWTWLYGFLASMLVIFCVRFAEWRWPSFERALWAACLVCPPLMYAAYFQGVFDPFSSAWLLGINAVVVVGVCAVGHYAWRRRTVESALLLAAGIVSMGFALRDRWFDFRHADQYPIWLTPYAGLLFIALIAWILIDRFVQTTNELERMNAELETRVENKSAQLGAALATMMAAKNSAETANRAKSSFLAAASHDLRQPIHALGLYLAALRSENLSELQKSLTERMNASVAALDSMFNTLLDISRMDAGTVKPLVRSFAIEPLLRRLVEEFSAWANAKGLRLSVRVASGIGAWHAHSDLVLVERVLRNLIGNAVKYTEIGGVLVTCRRRGDRARIEVWDTGCGIAPEECERVFDEFYQVGNPERSRAAGLGLGLSIVRRLAELLDLDLSLRSRPGRGTRFAFDMTLTRDAPRAASDPDAYGSLQGLAVAMIEDDPEVRDGMRTLLTRWGCTVIEGADADEVLAQMDAGAASPRAIVADFRLRGARDGIESIIALQDRFGPDIPALIVTGESAPERLADIEASGVAWMSKPVPAARLRSWLLSTLTDSPVAG